MDPRSLAVGVLAFALLAPTGAAAPLIDQIDNGGFEDGLAEWRTVEGEIELTDDAYEGENASLLNAVGDSGNTTLAQEVSLDNDDAPTVPNVEYEIAFAADLSSGADNEPTDPPSADAKIVWKNALGETSRVDTVPISVSDGFVEYNETFRAPADATAADVQFNLDPNGRTDANLKVDAVAFGPADPTASL